jgi:tripartite-type tricarboxylate transporter receptor subunit TctC
MAIVAAPTLNVNSLEGLVAVARNAPGALNYATVPGAPALAALDWKKRQGIALVSVPYRNPIAAVTDLVAGRIDLAVMPLSIVLGQAKSNKLRLLAIAHERRAPAMPEIPTAGEAGDPAFTVAGGLGLFVSKQAPSALRERIADDVQAILAEPEIRRRIEDLGYIARATRPAEFAALLDQQSARWADVARAHGLRLSP